MACSSPAPASRVRSIVPTTSAPARCGSVNRNAVPRRMSWRRNPCSSVQRVTHALLEEERAAVERLRLGAGLHATVERERDDRVQIPGQPPTERGPGHAMHEAEVLSEHPARPCLVMKRAASSTRSPPRRSPRQREPSSQSTESPESAVRHVPVRSQTHSATASAAWPGEGGREDGGEDESPSEAAHGVPPGRKSLQTPERKRNGPGSGQWVKESIPFTGQLGLDRAPAVAALLTEGRHRLL